MIEKCTNGAMVEVGYDRYETSTDTFTTLPIELIADTISAYTIKGNMEQNGTPTECGVRTEQLLDKDNIVDGGAYYPNASTNKMVASNNTLILLIPCEPNTTYTVSRTNAITKRFTICFLTSADIYEDMPVYGVAGSNNALTATSTSDVDSRYLCLYYAKSGGSDSSTSEEIQAQLAEVMINKGPTAKSYEPYGFKIPILSGGVTTNVYLNEPLRKIGAYEDRIDSVNGKLYRKIAKHIFMGTDDDSYSLNSDNTNTLAVNVNPDKVTQPAIKTTSNSKIYSDKLTYITNTSDVEHIYLTNGTVIDVGYRAAIRIYIDKSRLVGYSPTMTNAEKIDLVKTWLQNNTLTTYYITYTPTEENIELPNIPTTGTAEQFDVDTPIKPSEVSLTYTGWHNKSDVKF